jgi:hypothetical protein
MLQIFVKILEWRRFKRLGAKSMKNKIIILVGLALAIGATGCSHEDSKKLSNDLKNTGEAVKQTATDAAEAAKKTADEAANSPKAKEAAEQTKKAVKATADFVEDTGKRAADATKKAAEKAKENTQNSPKP